MSYGVCGSCWQPFVVDMYKGPGSPQTPSHVTFKPQEFAPHYFAQPSVYHEAAGKGSKGAKVFPNKGAKGGKGSWQADGGHQGKGPGANHYAGSIQSLGTWRQSRKARQADKDAAIAASVLASESEGEEQDLSRKPWEYLATARMLKDMGKKVSICPEAHALLKDKVRAYESYADAARPLSEQIEFLEKSRHHIILPRLRLPSGGPL